MQETKIRLQAGPILNTVGGSQTATISLNSITGTTVYSYFHRTAYNASGYVELNEGVSDNNFFTDLFVPLYDSETYDDSTYSPDAYTVHTYDTGGAEFQDITQFVVNCNNTKGTIYYRTFDVSTEVKTSLSSAWTNGGATVNGDKTITFATSDRFLQVAIVYDGVAWGDDLRLNSITVTYQSDIEYIYKGVFYLDRPKFTDPSAPNIPVIICNGRDAYKKALNYDINLPDLTSGVSVNQLFKDICDQVGISYSATSIEAMSGFSNRTLADGVEVLKADKIFELLMQILNPTGYQMYLQYDDTFEDNILYVQPKPTTDLAIGAFNFRNYESIGDVSKNTDRLIQRATLTNTDETPTADVLLDTLAVSTTGAKTMSWVDNADFKRIVIDKPNDITISALELNIDGAEFNVDAVTGTVTIQIYGSKYASNPTVDGEALMLANHLNGLGATVKFDNPLVLSNAEAKSICESFISQYGDPTIEARDLRWPYLNVLPEINDQFVLFRRFIFTDDIFFVSKITHHWSSGRNPNEYTVFNLEDTGLSKASPNWDDGVSNFDTGLVWDMGISNGLNTDTEINAIAEAAVVHNVDFT